MNNSNVYDIWYCCRLLSGIAMFSTSIYLITVSKQSLLLMPVSFQADHRVLWLDDNAYAVSWRTTQPACRRCAVMSASDLSGFSWSPFCMNQSLMSAVQVARLDRPEASCVVSTHRQVKLGVIGILMVVNAVWCYDIGNWTTVNGEQQKS